MLALYAVILNEVKNLLSDNTLSTLSLVGFEEIATSGKALLAMTIILSAVIARDLSWVSLVSRVSP